MGDFSEEITTGVTFSIDYHYGRDLPRRCADWRRYPNFLGKLSFSSNGRALTLLTDRLINCSIFTTAATASAPAARQTLGC